MAEQHDYVPPGLMIDRLNEENLRYGRKLSTCIAGNLPVTTQK